MGWWKRIKSSRRILLLSVKDPLLIFLSLIFVAVSGLFWAFQYFVLGLYVLGFAGMVLSLWHVIAFALFAVYVDYRRGQTFLKWKYEAKGITSKTVDDYVEYIKEKKD